MPIGLAAFRTKYPQYNDMSDAKLGEALRQKHYADMPEEQYWDKIGVENPHPIRTRAHEALEDVRQDFATPPTPRTGRGAAMSALRQAPDLMFPETKALKTAGDIANVGLSAVGGGAEHAMGALQHALGPGKEIKLNPFLQRALSVTPVGPAIQQWNQGVKNPALARRQAGDIAEAITPVPGVEALEGLSDVAKIGRISREFNVSRATARQMLKAGTHDPGVFGGAFKPPRTPADALHQERVRRLERQGVKFTPGTREGGHAKVYEQREKTGSLSRGYGIHQAEQDSLESFHRVALDKPLKVIGHKGLGPGGPIGHEGVKAVRDALSTFYTKTLKGGLARQDTAFKAEMKRINAEVDKLNAEGRMLFKNAIAKEMTPRFRARSGTPAATMTGTQFKAAESELKKLGKQLMGDGNHFHRQAGELLREVAGALRDSVDRNSPRAITQQLKKADIGWAMLKRLESAAVKATDKDGVFNTANFSAAVKAEEQRGAGQAGKARVGLGQALLQDFARDAHGVLKGVVRDPGTAAQSKLGLAGRAIAGAVGAGLGHVAHTVGHIPFAGEIGGTIGASLGGPVDRAINEARNEATRLKLTGKMAGPKPQTRSPVAGTLKGVGVASGASLEEQRAQERARMERAKRQARERSKMR